MSAIIEVWTTQVEIEWRTCQCCDEPADMLVRVGQQTRHGGTAMAFGLCCEHGLMVDDALKGVL